MSFYRRHHGAITEREQHHETLVRAAGGCQPLYVERSDDAQRLYGCVVGVSEKWLLLHYLEDGYFLNGYVAVRMKDLRQVNGLGSESVIAVGLNH